MSLSEIESLLHSPIHEERHLALLILVLQVTKSNDEQRQAVYNFYLQNTGFINNWDLVDCSAPQIVGGHLLDKSRKPLFQLAKSKALWERRIAIVSTQHFIRHDDFTDTLAISEKLLNDQEDLIHKATGWMLREVGQKDQAILVEFLDQYASVMPENHATVCHRAFFARQRREYLKG